MSNRTLIELNHDYAPELSGATFVGLLARYLASGGKEDAAMLERLGAKVVAMRHHADPFYIPVGTDGFPANYYTPEPPK